MCAPLPAPLGGGRPEVSQGAPFWTGPPERRHDVLPVLFPGAWTEVRILTLGQWILAPGALPGPSKCLSLGCGVFLGGLPQLCGGTWVGSDLSTGGHFLGSLSQPWWRRGSPWGCPEFREGLCLRNSLSTGEGTCLWVIASVLREGRGSGPGSRFQLCEGDVSWAAPAQPSDSCR